MYIRHVGHDLTLPSGIFSEVPGDGAPGLATWREQHSLVDDNPYKAAEQSEEGDAGEDPMTPAAEWKWLEPAPTEWSPQVQQEAEIVTVTFLTHSGLGGEAIYRHTDTYKPGAYRFESERQQVATGGGGYVF